jgi:hypothetical protein
MSKYALLSLIFSLMPLQVIAAERVDVCAKYETNGGWSSGYKVSANVMKGTELNAATRSFNYNSFSTYIVIFWAKEEASVIEMDWPYLSAIGQGGKDQQGRKWEIAKTAVCF